MCVWTGDFLRRQRKPRRESSFLKKKKHVHPFTRHAAVSQPRHTSGDAKHLTARHRGRRGENPRKKHEKKRSTHIYLHNRETFPSRRTPSRSISDGFSMGRSLVAGKLADAVFLINTEVAQEKADARRCVHACSVARFARVVGQHWGGGGNTRRTLYL